MAESSQKRLRKAAEPIVTATAIAAESDSIIAELRTYGIRELKTLNRESGKSTGGEELNDFYKRAVRQIVKVHALKDSVIVVVGPGFLKEDFAEVGKSRLSEIFKDV